MPSSWSITRPKRLESLDILREYTGKTCDRDWVAPEVIAVIEQESPEFADG